MIHIPLIGDKYAIIDDSDLELISGYKWRYEKNRNTFYAIATIKGKARNIRMHRLIMNAQKGQKLDHISHNGLDNRKINLRFVTDRQNRMNSYSHSFSSSQYKGVSWCRKINKWIAFIESHYLGSYSSEIIAAWVYDQFAKKLFGKFARLNFDL